MPRAAPRKLTYDDYVGFPDDGFQHEIIDGEHHVTPAPTFRHQDLASALAVSLGGFVTEHKLGRVLFAPLDVVFTPHDVVQPDILFLSSAKFAVARSMQEGCLRIPPDLIVEILSPSTRRKDQEFKHRLYERTGVSEYWIVGSERTVVTIYRRTEPTSLTYAAAIELSADNDDALTTPLLPNWTMPLSNFRA